MSACKQNGSSIWSPNLNEPLVREMLEETMHANMVTGLWTGVRRKNDGFSVYYFFFTSGPKYEVPKATTMKMAQNLTTRVRKVSLQAFE